MQELLQIRCPEIKHLYLLTDGFYPYLDIRALPNFSESRFVHYEVFRSSCANVPMLAVSYGNKNSQRGAVISRSLVVHSSAHNPEVISRH